MGRLLKRPLKVSLFRSGLPKVAVLHLCREGWENTEGVRTGLEPVLIPSRLSLCKQHVNSFELSFSPILVKESLNKRE